jgi:hypothetical protein
MSSDEVHNLAQLYERYSEPVFGYLLRLSKVIAACPSSPCMLK